MDGTVRFQCDCGKSLVAKAALSGRRVKCPNCGVALVIPAPTPAPETERRPAPRGDDPPEGTDWDVVDTPTQRVISDVRRVAQYWRKRNHTDGTMPPFDGRKLPKNLEKHGEPEALFTADSVRTFVSQLGCGVFGSLLVLSVLFGVLAFVNTELREDHPWIIALAVLVAVTSVVGWVFAARAAKKDAKRFALLYPTGFAIFHPDNCRFYAWSDIEEVIVKPESRDNVGLVLWGHEFVVKTAGGAEETLRMEYNAVIELGLVIMERAAAEGATCSGKVRREQQRNS